MAEPKNTDLDQLVTREEAIELFMHELDCQREQALAHLEGLIAQYPNFKFFEGH